jgi:transposase-like protein
MAQSVLDAPHFTDERAAFAYVEAHLWPEGPVCPHCGETSRIGRLNGKTTRPGLHKCYACKKPFTVRIGTIFEDSHLPLHLWLQVIHLFCASKKGIATRQIQRMLKCSMKTAWFLGHRIREAMTDHRGIFSDRLGGAGITVEVDETYMGRKASSKAFLPPAEKSPVFALVERQGQVRSFHVPTVTANGLRGIMARNINKQSDLMSDESKIYTFVGHNFASHGTVRHADREYVRGIVHTNTIEGFFSILKRGIYGVYQHVSEEHLRRYLAEFDFRYNNREKLGVDDTRRAQRALRGTKGKRLTYQTTRKQAAQGQAATA